MASDGVVLRVHASPETDPAGDRIPDELLLRQMMDGSEAALASLYDRHLPVVFSMAMRVSRDPGIAEEVVQETFLTLWDRAELFDPSRGALPAWLATIARNRAINHLRSAQRHDRAAMFSSMGSEDTDESSLVEWLLSSGEPLAMGRPEAGPETASLNNEFRELIDDALASLPAIERGVILLAYGEGLSQSEIAERLGWPIGTVKTRTRRALRRLRDRLESADAAMTTPSLPRSDVGAPGLGEIAARCSAMASATPCPIAAPCL